MPPYHEGTFEGAIKEFTARSPGLHTTHPRKERALVGEKDFRRKSTREEKALCKYGGTEEIEIVQRIEINWSSSSTDHAHVSE